MPLKIHTRLRLSGIDLPFRADEQLSVSVRQIDSASDLRRTVNGELVRVARSVFDRYAISISGGGLNAAPLSGLVSGQYVEVSLPDPVYLRLGADRRSASYPRAMVDVEGWTKEGVRLNPLVAPADVKSSMTDVFDAVRIAALRAPTHVRFSGPIQAVRGRPVLACRVISWDLDGDDVSKAATWSLELEEA